VPRDQLATANALEMLGFTIGGIIGPMVAGVLIVYVGAPNVVVIDALSYFAFAFALATIHVTPATQSHKAAGGANFGHAVQLLLKQPILFSTTFMFMAFNVGDGIVSVWLPILIGQLPGGGAGLYGLMLAVLACGEVLSSVLAGGRVWPLALGTLICIAQALSGVPLGLLLFGQNVWLVGGALVLYGISNAPMTIWAQTLRMQIIPEHLRGRTFALLRTIMQGGRPFGSALGGSLLPVLGLPLMILLSALLVGVPGVLGGLVKTLREAGRPQAAQAAGEVAEQMTTSSSSSSP
jgi:MFS family permease